MNFQGLSLSQVSTTEQEIVEEAGEVSASDVAVIGIGIDFPQARTVESFWGHLREGRDLIGTVPGRRRRDVDEYLASRLRDEDVVEYSEVAYLGEIDTFDHRFFKLSPLEASLMDPNQRLFLQCAWWALEDAGYAGKRAAGSATGVYVGLNPNLVENYLQFIRDVAPEMLGTALPGNLSAMVASRISYFLNLTGPSLVVNTACSSSLVALHLACQALKTGDCDMALAGGVHIRLLPLVNKDSLASPADGRTRTFDDQAAGTGSGEGAAAVLLKPLRRALVDGDHVYAVIKGSAVNQDGATNGITVPSARAQAAVIDRAWRSAGVNPETIRYVEAHGSATELGDPIECEGITEAFRHYTDRLQFCGIGSVKPNLGHLDAAAGIAGFIKAVLALHYRELPKTIQFERPNRKIPFVRSPVFVQAESEPWDPEPWPRRCGVSSFGLSGTNCHVVLEEAAPYQVASHQRPHLFTVSAKSRTALAALLRSYISFLGQRTESDLAAICYTASTGRGHFRFRAAALAASADELRTKLERLLENGLPSDEEGAWFQEHNVVPASKLERESGDVTTAEVQVASEAARRLVCGQQDHEALVRLGHLYVSGAEVDWEALYDSTERRRVRLPLYPFDRTRCWPEVPPLAQAPLYSAPDWVEYPLAGGDEAAPAGRTLILTGKEAGAQVAGWLQGLAQAGMVFETGHLDGAVSAGNFARILYLGAWGEQAEEESLYDLLRLVQELGGKAEQAEIELVLAAPTVHAVTRDEPALHAAHASMFGLGKTVAAEYPNLLVRCLDLDESVTAAELFAELAVTDPPHLVAYRGGCRYLQQIAEVPREAFDRSPVPVRPHGVYLITGGTGGMGLEIAKYLASRAPVRLALVSRQPGRTESQLAAIREIEAAGSDVLLYSADVADEAAMKGVLADLRRRYGALHGVVHAAGVAGAGALWAKTQETFDAVLAPKIRGTQILDRLTREDRLDFFVLFSAMTALTGGFGQGDYTAANAFLDAFAEARAKLGERTLSINWAAWRETGMGVTYGVASREEIFLPLWTCQAVEAFELALGSDLNQVLVGALNPRDLPRIKGFLDQPRSPVRLDPRLLAKVDRSDRSEGAVQAPPPAAIPGEEEQVELCGRPSGDYSEREWQLARIWRRTLGVTKVDLYDTFYELGGDSIFAAKAAHAIRADLGLSLSIVEFLQHLTIADLALFLDERAAGGGGEAGFAPIEPAPTADAYPLSAAQHRLFVLHQLQPEQTAYNVTLVLELDGELHQERFEHAFQAVVDRHESLRTYFKVVDGIPAQVVLPKTAAPIRYVQAAEAEVAAAVEAAIQPFDLQAGPPVRITLIQVNVGRHVLVVDLHHMIADGFSISVLAEEFFTAYDGNELPPMPVQYKDYVRWQNEQLSGEALEEHRRFWLSRFAGALPVLALPTDFPRPAVQSFTGDRLIVRVEQDMLARLKELAVTTNTTMFMLLLAAFNVLLAKYANQEEIIVGSPVAGRTHPQANRLIGMFVNTLAFRNRPRGDARFAEFLAAVKHNALQAYEHQEYPFDRLVSELSLPKDPGRNTLFDAMFVMHNEPQYVLSDLPLRIRTYPAAHRTAKVDLTLEATIEADGLLLVFEFATALFREATIQRAAGDFVRILKAVASNPSLLLQEIELESGWSPLANVLTREIEFKF